MILEVSYIVRKEMIAILILRTVTCDHKDATTIMRTACIVIKTKFTVTIEIAILTKSHSQLRTAFSCSYGPG